MTMGQVIALIKSMSGGGGGGGGSDVFVVHYDTGTSTADKTFSEIRSSIADGQVVLLRDNDGYCYWIANAGVSEIEFQSFIIDENELFLTKIVVTELGWTADFGSYTLTPAT